MSKIFMIAVLSKPTFSGGRHHSLQVLRDHRWKSRQFDLQKAQGQRGHRHVACQSAGHQVLDRLFRNRPHRRFMGKLALRRADGL
jgi:hypothetical protein